MTGAASPDFLLHEAVHDVVNRHTPRFNAPGRFTVWADADDRDLFHVKLLRPANEPDPEPPMPKRIA